MSSVKVISRVERLGTSFLGNPHFRVHFSDGSSARTKVDSMINYSITNSNNHGVPVAVSTTKAGRIYNVVKIDDNAENSQAPF